MHQVANQKCHKSPCNSYNGSVWPLFTSMQSLGPDCSRARLKNSQECRQNFEKITKASVLAEFFFALAMLWWEGLRALKIDISS